MARRAIGASTSFMSIVAPVPAAPSHRARHVAIAIRLWRLARIVSVLVLAAWSLLLVAWLTLHWGILPHIEQWRPQIERRASAALGVPVQIGNITVRSGGWMPSVELRDVTLQDAQGRTALHLPRVYAALSARSLLTLTLRFEQLLIDGAQLEVRRDADGRLHIAGLAFGGDSAEDDNDAANWFFQQHEFVVRDGALRWIDEQRGAPPLELRDVQFVVRNSLRRHLLRLDATPPAEWGERFSLRGRFTHALLDSAGDWRRWSGVAYAMLPRVDASRLRHHLTLPFELHEGEGALRAWIDLREGEASGATVDLALDHVDLRLAPELEALQASQIEGRVSAQRSATGWRVAARQFGFVAGESLRWPRGDMALSVTQRADQPATGGDFSAEHLDLELMAQIAAAVPLGSGLRELLAELQPQGTASDLRLRWEGAVAQPRSYRLEGLLSGLTLAARSADDGGMGRPGVRNADLQLRANERGGQATLTMAGGALEFPGLLADPVIVFDQLGAELQWRIDSGSTGAPKISVQAREASFANADAQGRLTLDWRTGAGDGEGRGGRFPGVIALEGSLSRALPQRVAHYLPLDIPKDTRDYVAQALRGGRVSGATFRVKGDLWDFPFADARNADQGEFRVVAQAEDLTLAYVPDTAAEPLSWPVFTQVSGEVIFDRSAMQIRDARARVFGVELAGVSGGIRDLDERPVLALEGQAHGPLADMLRFVNTSPLGEWLDGALAQASASGGAALDLALALPLYDLDASTVKGRLTLAGNDVRIDPGTPLLGAARGRITFTHQSFALADASAQVLGGEVRLAGGMQADGSLRFSASGSATAEGLRAAGELGPLANMAASLQGRTDYRLTFDLLHGHSEFELTSDLAGLALDLPAPLRKSANTPLPLRIAATLEPAAGDGAMRDRLRIRLGDVLQAEYLRELRGTGTPRVLRGAIGVMEPAPPPLEGVAAQLTLPTLDVDAWQAVMDRWFPASTAASEGDDAPTEGADAYLPTRIALRVQDLAIGSRRLQRVLAGVSQEGRVWRANLDAEQLNGYVEYRPPRGSVGAGRLFARLSRLSLPKTEADVVGGLLDEQPTTVPALDIVVDDFELRGKSLGRVEIDAVNRGRRQGRPEWRLNRLVMTTAEARLVATGSWAAAEDGARRRMAMDFDLELLDSGRLLERLGSGGTLRGGKGRMAGEVSWVGSPLAIDYESLSGRVHLALDAGQFLKAEPGAARLLGVLSLQSLPRRLALDFRDVFQEGFAFDNIVGDATIDQGVASTNNLRMRGVQAVVLMEGSADIAHETQDLRVIVVPEINAGTASLAYAVINPAVGLATFLAQALLRKPMIEAGTREFHITGSWADPKVERVDRTPPATMSPDPALPAAPANPAPASPPR